MLWKKYLSFIAFNSVKAHPLICLGGIGHFLVCDPLDGGSLQEGTDLEETEVSIQVEGLDSETRLNRLGSEWSLWLTS